MANEYSNVLSECDIMNILKQVLQLNTYSVRHALILRSETARSEY